MITLLYFKLVQYFKQAYQFAMYNPYACIGAVLLLIIVIWMRPGCSSKPTPPLIDTEKIQNQIDQIEDRNNKELANQITVIDRQINQADRKVEGVNINRNVTAKELEERLKR